MFQPQTDATTPPVATAPGLGVGYMVSPTSYLLHRSRRDMSYQGLVDPVNERLIIKQPQFRDAARFATDVLRAARAHDAGKLLVYAGEDQWRQLLAQGFALEGILDGYLHGEPAYIMASALTGTRHNCGDVEREQAVLEAALAAATEPAPELPGQYRLVSCGSDMAEALAEVYGEVFTSFPSPLNETDFVHRMIRSGAAIFLAVLDGDRIASVAAAEIDREFKAAETTNCATRSAYRGEGMMQVLLHELENEMRREEIFTLFSLARAPSFGMNRALSKAGYSFRGRLLCNSHIMGGYETMNLWVRRLPD